MVHYLIFKRAIFLAAFIFFISAVFSFDASTQAVENDAEIITPKVVENISAQEIIANNDVIPDAAPENNISLGVGKPARLMIPSINVDAYIEHLGLTDEGAVMAPDGARNVSWFDLGPRPGEMGSAVISGHYGRWKNGTNSVFNLLPDLRPGDSIYVKDDNGSQTSFIVKEVRVYGRSEIVPEIFNRNDKAYLNIITCHGTYLEGEKTYSQRLVVFAEAQ